MKKRFYYILLVISMFISCNSHNTIHSSNINKSFSEQFFTNQNVYRVLKKYVPNGEVNITDPNHNITKELLVLKNNDLVININTDRKIEYDFFVKKVIVDKNLAFIVLWYKDSTTALCFYPIKSEYTPNKWIIEDITTKSIK